MAEYPPPLNFNPIFNPYQYSQSDEKLTIGTGDVRYLKLAGGTETGPVTFNSGVVLNDGSNVQPAMRFFNSTATGFHKGGTHQIHATCNGADVMKLTPTHIDADEPIRLSNDTPALCFQGDTTTGMYSLGTGSNTIGLMTNGVQRFRVENTFSQFLNNDLLITHTNTTPDPMLRLYANRVTGGQICDSTIIQKSTNSSDKALTFKNSTADLTATDITYRFQASGTSEEVQMNRRSQLLLASGSVANPALAFNFDDTSGLNLASSAIFMSVAGVERQRWSSANGIRFSSGGTNFKNMQFGTISYTTSLAAGAAIVIGPYSFPSAFGSNPQVFLQAFPQSGSSWWDRVWYTIASVSTTNFTIQIANSAGSPTSASPGVVIQWFALGG